MDSVTIKTYLLDFIYDILDNEKFKQIFKPVQDEDISLKKLSQAKKEFLDPNFELTNIKSSSSKLLTKQQDCMSQDNLIHSSKENQNFSIFVIFDSFILCIKKVLQLLFIEKKKDAHKLYFSLYDRLGESVLLLLNGSY